VEEIVNFAPGPILIMRSIDIKGGRDIAT
jgi:hypothetical protein